MLKIALLLLCSLSVLTFAGVSPSPNQKSFASLTWGDAGGYRISWSLPTSERISIRILSAGGRIMKAMNSEGKSGSLLINFNGIAQGLYCIEVTSESQRRSFSILR